MTAGTCRSRSCNGRERDLVLHLDRHAAQQRATRRALIEMNLHALGQLLVELAGNVLLDVRLNFAATDVAIGLQTVMGTTKLLHRQTADK